MKHVWLKLTISTERLNSNVAIEITLNIKIMFLVYCLFVICVQYFNTS